MNTNSLKPFSALIVLVMLCLPFLGCGEKSGPSEKNLLSNGSFEAVDGGIPKGWRILVFRGLQDQKGATYAVDDTLAYDGDRSFRLQADADTRRFYTLSQEIEVKKAKRIRVRGAIKCVDCYRRKDQYPQANFALTYYDDDHNRFKSVRFYDKNTKTQVGTTDDWVLVDQTFRLPNGTRYIVLHCAMGMDGTIWFDDISLDIPPELNWNQRETKNFVFHWMDEKEFPEGSQEYQQELYDLYASRLGIREEDRRVVSYYLYPDTASIKETLGLKSVLYVNWDDAEVHSILPVDDHEIVHVLTHQYGTLPLTLAEGTAYYLIGNLDGDPIQPTAQKLLQEGKLPQLSMMLEYAKVNQLQAGNAVIAGASFVGFLVEFLGTEQFLELHRASHKMETYERFAAAFEEVYGKSLAEAERTWKEILRTADFSKWEKQAEEQ